MRFFAALCVILLFLFGSLISPGKSYAQLVPSPLLQDVLGTANASVSARVGELYVTLYGFIAPYASVTLVSGNVPIRSTVADANGYFNLSQILVSIGFSHFCLDAVDFKRLGESEACFDIPAMHANYTKGNIFLPPTLGVFRSEINAGTKVLAYGYSMPGAKVSVHVSDGQVVTVTADSTGYYEVNLPLNKPGDYLLSADAVYQNQKSEVPTKKVSVKVLSLTEQVGKTTQENANNVWNFLNNLPYGILWLALPILILIIILLYKLHPEWFPHFGTPIKGFEKYAYDMFFKDKRLHHFWMKGVGY